MTSIRARAIRAAAVLCAVTLPLTLLAQRPAAPPPAAVDAVLEQEGYATPPRELAEAVLAPRHLNVSLSNVSRDKKWFLHEVGDGPIPMKTFAKPFHELGGVFIDYKANRARALTVRNNVGIQVISAADGSQRAIQLPAGARVSNATWSPDHSTIGFFVHGDDATHIWVADAATGKSRQLTRTPVLATLVSTFEFTEDGKQIVLVQIPDSRAPMPQPPTAPSGPTVRIADAEKNRLRTFPSLLSSPHEKELLEWHSTGQIAFVDVQKGTTRKVGSPAMIRAIDASPDARFIRVTRLAKPFSYDVPVSNFGTVEEVWDADGKVLAKVTERPLDLGVQDDNQPGDPPSPGGGRGQNERGKREVAWRPDNQGFTYLEQEPPPTGRSGDSVRGRGATDRPADDEAQDARGGRDAARKDRLYQWSPPFDEASRKLLYENGRRMSNPRFSPDMKMFFASERNGQNTTEFAVDLSQPSSRHVLARYRTEDVYTNPGTLVSARGVVGGGGRGSGGGGRGGEAAANGPILLSADGASVYFHGTAYDRNPQQVGPKTFIDKVAIESGAKERIFETDNNGVFERLATIVDISSGRYIVEREGPREVPQYYFIDGGRRTQLTHNQDYTPDITRARHERITVERADGFKFHATVTSPEDIPPGTKPPGLFWFYPREYEDQESYDRPERTFNKNAFQTFGTRSVEYFIRLGYAVVEPDAPIVGPQGRMNNNYVHDLRNNLAAVIDEIDRRGLADRTRLAIGGHSYGAFSAVNAMVHTPFFKAGIAGDGAYNRTLTPIGFQTERRDLWEAPNVYLSMSPFLYANNLTGALLMYHGLGDQNVGTDPTNSIRLYHALNGLGKTTALYLYPLEDHGPAARETLLDLWARWAAWLDKYVKNPRSEDRRKSTTESASR
jgi:dipeptidyl aminopeptidase/acylaminoacyl peptidase